MYGFILSLELLTSGCTLAVIIMNEFSIEFTTGLRSALQRKDWDGEYCRERLPIQVITRSLVHLRKVECRPTIAYHSTAGVDLPP